MVTINEIKWNIFIFFIQGCEGQTSPYVFISYHFRKTYCWVERKLLNGIDAQVEKIVVKKKILPRCDQIESFLEDGWNRHHNIITKEKSE